jgi:signal transduction histidine kinase
MFRTLRARLILAFASVAILSLVVALVGFLYLIRDREISAARERVGVLVSPVAFQVQLKAQSGVSQQDIIDYLDEEAKDLQVRFLLLSTDSSQPTVLSDSSGQLTGKTLDLSSGDLHFSSTGPTGFGYISLQVAGTQQVIFQPSPFAPPQVRTVPSVVQTEYRVLMAVPEEDLTAVWAALAPRILLAAGAGLLLAVVLSIVIARSIVRPLGRMTRASEEMARGHYRQRIEVKGQDEVGRLAAAFNGMAEQVGHSDQMMRDLLANVAHELKTPLTSIQGFSQALTEGAVHTPQEYAQAARIINDEAERMRRLVEDLLYLSQIESGQVRMEHEPVDIGMLLRDSLERVERRALEGGQQLVLEMPARLPPVIGDERRLEQVVSNLLDNALRYTPRGGSVRLRGVQTGEQIEIAVLNSGSYIPPEDLPRVFERFYRVERARSGRNGGLGLAIAAEVVAAHGGQIDASSSPDRGTEFRVTLPVASATALVNRVPEHVLARR